MPWYLKLGQLAEKISNLTDLLINTEELSFSPQNEFHLLKEVKCSEH